MFALKRAQMNSVIMRGHVCVCVCVTRWLHPHSLQCSKFISMTPQKSALDENVCFEEVRLACLVSVESVEISAIQRVQQSGRF